MFEKIFRIAFNLMLSAALFLPILIMGVSSVSALSSEASGNNPLKIVIEPSEGQQSLDNNNSVDDSRNSGMPDLGDDQVFPFVAGLDAYEGSQR